MRKKIVVSALSLLALTSCTSAGAGSEQVQMTNQREVSTKTGVVGSFKQELPSGRTVECVSISGYTIDSGSAISCDWERAK